MTKVGQPIPRRLTYAVVGAVLAIGAPIGLLFVRFAFGGEDAFRWMEELVRGSLTYSYIAISTTLAFGLFGWFLGRHADRLIALATTDELTRLLNSRGFHMRVNEELARAGRSGQPVSLLIIDLDSLKSINDRYGHDVGDLALQAIGETLREILRVTDVAGRLGGDEFAVLAPNMGGRAAVALGERIRTRAVEAESEIAGLVATVSVGVVTFDPNSQEVADAAALMKSADKALYDAKHYGGDRVKKL
jgi:diguanylate cyclase (GGDEF)-like protein